MTLFLLRFLGTGFLALCLLVSGVYAAPQKNNHHDSMIARVVADGRLVVGVSVSEPWAMKNGSGQWLGYDIDVAQRLAQDLGVEVRFERFNWDKLIAELMAGRIDIIISSMSITTARNLSVNFSIPYANSGIRILANKQKAGHFTEPEAFNNPSVILAVRSGTEVLSVAETHFPNARIQQYADESQMLAAVRNGKVSALLAATPFPEFMAERYPKELAMPLTERLQRSSEAMAIGKQDADSMNVINNWILQKLENGWLQDRHDYWFTSTEWRKRLE